jgi:DNA damage-inducible protein 1
MKISILTDKDELINLDVTPELIFSELKKTISEKINVPVDEIILIYNGNPIQDDTKTIKDFSISDDDIVQLIRRPKVQQAQSIPQQQNPYENLRLQLKADKYQFALMKRRFPTLESVIDNPKAFEEEFKKIEQEMQERKRKELEELQYINDNPFDIEAQRKIENAIKKENVNKNYEYAMEHHPEFFGDITMLYINCEMNNHPMKAFVDTGAQKTIMSPECVEACGMSYLIDERFTGIAQGVGVAKILGVIHNANIKIGNSLFATTISVLENQKIDLILGLDMLKRHQVIIDLGEGVLKIGSESVPFLAEHEIPKRVVNKEELKGQLDKGKQIETPKPASNPTPITNDSGSSSETFPEESIKDLMNLGFSRLEVIQALKLANGDKNMAASLLF